MQVCRRPHENDLLGFLSCSYLCSSCPYLSSIFKNHLFRENSNFHCKPLGKKCILYRWGPEVGCEMHRLVRMQICSPSLEVQGVWRGLQRLYLSLVHMHALSGSKLYTLPCSCTPLSPVPDTKKASGSLLVSVCPGREEAVMILNLPLQQNFPVVVPASLGHIAGLLSTLGNSRKWHQQLESFLSGRYRCVPACLSPKHSLVWIWSSLRDGDCICAGKHIKKTWYLRGGKTHPKCRWIPDQTQRRNSSKHQHLSPAFWMQMQYGQVPYSCYHSVFFPCWTSAKPWAEMNLSSLSYFVFIFGHSDKKIN